MVNKEMGSLRILQVTYPDKRRSHFSEKSGTPICHDRFISMSSPSVFLFLSDTTSFPIVRLSHSSFFFHVNNFPFLKGDT